MWLVASLVCCRESSVGRGIRALTGGKLQVETNLKVIGARWDSAFGTSGAEVQAYINYSD